MNFEYPHLEWEVLQGVFHTLKYPEKLYPSDIHQINHSLPHGLWQHQNRIKMADHHHQ